MVSSQAGRQSREWEGGGLIVLIMAAEPLSLGTSIGMASLLSQIRLIPTPATDKLMSPLHLKGPGIHRKTGQSPAQGILFLEYLNIPR